MLGAGRDSAALVEALLEDARRHAPRAPRSVYLGGGTPTFLPPADLARLLDGLQELTGFRSSAAEVSAECNPESLTPETARALVAGGVTRLSLGLQSLRDDILAFLGRPHNRAQALAAYAVARAAGPRSVGFDLIFAVPGLSQEAWAADLAEALALGPDHLSAYALTWEEGTALNARRGSPGHYPAPDDVELEQLWATRSLAACAGLAPYEVSNFARSGHECSHNINYWMNGDYIGLGPSAVSHLGARRWGQPRDLATWRTQLAGAPAQLSATQAAEATEARRALGHSESAAAPGGAAAAEAPAPAWEERLDSGARLGESWWLGLRLTRGVDPGALRRSVGLPAAEDHCLPIARRLVADGLLEQRSSRLCLTDRGLPLADAVGREFLAP